MTHKFGITIEQDKDGFYVGKIPALPGCVVKRESIDELFEQFEKAIAIYLKAQQGVKHFYHSLTGFVYVK